MAVTDAQIRGIHESFEFREMMVKVNNAAATAADINTANLSLAEKTLLLDLVGSPSRAGVMSRSASIEEQAVALAQAGI